MAEIQTSSPIEDIPSAPPLLKNAFGKLVFWMVILLAGTLLLFIGWLGSVFSKEQPA